MPLSYLKMVILTKIKVTKRKISDQKIDRIFHICLLFILQLNYSNTLKKNKGNA